MSLSHLSPKQYALVQYLLDRIGFIKGPLRDSYSDSISVKSTYFRVIEKILYSGLPGSVLNDANRVFPYNEISLLFDEINIKKNRLFLRTGEQKSYLRASEIGTFVFCPAAFVIQSSISIPDTENLDYGTELHEIQLLNKRDAERLFEIKSLLRKRFSKTSTLDLIDTNTVANVLQRVRNDQNAGFFAEISNADIVFDGHSGPNHERESFFNQRLGVACSPDYVFRRNNGSYFVVEEKFHRTNEFYSHDHAPLFFANHKVQLAAYLHYVHDYKFTNGYLVNWYYQIENGTLTVYRCDVLEMRLNDRGKTFVDVAYTRVNQLASNQVIDFPVQQINPKKCANCACSVFCGHKTGRFDKLTYPYAPHYSYLWHAEYPEALTQPSNREIL